MARSYENRPPTALQRLKEYARDDEWIRSFLREAKIARVATSFDGQPFVMANTFWYDEPNNRVIFHSSPAGRLHANIEKNPKVCLEASEMGEMLPSNVALEFSLQYRSAMVFGTAKILADADEARAALYGLIKKYFPTMTPGREFRPITDKELKQTAVYALEIESWSGKENWKSRAVQSDEWLPLQEEWFEEFIVK